MRPMTGVKPHLQLKEPSVDERYSSVRLWCCRKMLMSSQKITSSTKNKASASRWSQTCLLQTTFSFPAWDSCPVPWNNSAFSASLLSFNGCPSVIILLRSLILLEDKGWSGKLLCSCTVCWYSIKEKVVVMVEIGMITEDYTQRLYHMVSLHPSQWAKIERKIPRLKKCQKQSWSFIEMS